ncbi:MAG: hypothetical protein ACP5NW_03860 [Candidatus Woesearchaeota archaeon]
MKMFFRIFFVLAFSSVFVLSSASLILAETASDESGGDSLTTPDGNVISIEDYAERITASDDTAASAPGVDSEEDYITQCMTGSEAYSEMAELEMEINEKFDKGEDITELKSKMTELRLRLAEQRNECLGLTISSGPSKIASSNPADAKNEKSAAVMPETAVPSALSSTAVEVGIRCELPEDLKDERDSLFIEYKSAIESEDFENAKLLREKISMLEDDARDIRERCIIENVPGLMKQDNKTCEIPEGVYDRLENIRYNISQMKRANNAIPENLTDEIDALESEIAQYKAKCNALKFSDDVEESDVAGYYKNRIMEAMANENEDSKVQELKELRKEIDESIKNMIEKNKMLRYSEMDGIVDKIEFKANNVRVGDSETNTTEVEIVFGTVDGSPDVKIRPTDSAVLLTQAGRDVLAEDITVNDSGIYVHDILVNELPAVVFYSNKNLERNAERIMDMKLEKSGDTAVYTARYEVKKKIFGIIPANARHELVVDAQNGKTLQDNRPWWSILATTIDDKQESNLVESTSTLVELETGTV